MTWLALSYALATQPSPPTPPPWRLVSRTDVHVGLRLAALISTDEVAAGATVQITASALTL